MGIVVFIGGPSGTGKSTVAQQLFEQLKDAKSCFLIEGDDWHSKPNIEKMSNNIPLNDTDRWPWLEKLTQLAEYNSKNYEVVIITCSMLKKSYRDFIKSKLENKQSIRKLFMFLLCNEYEIVLQQMKKRKNHFFKESMLKSQYLTFEKSNQSSEINVFNIQCNNKTPIQLSNEIISFF